MDDKNRFKMQADRSTDQLSDKQRQIDQLQQKLTATKELCGELENQINDYEALMLHNEGKECEWQTAK